jgi:hypothetical protein
MGRDPERLILWAMPPTESMDDSPECIAVFDGIPADKMPVQSCVARMMDRPVPPGYIRLVISKATGRFQGTSAGWMQDESLPPPLFMLGDDGYLKDFGFFAGEVLTYWDHSLVTDEIT